MRTGAKIVAAWIACVIVSVFLANLVVLFLDDIVGKKHKTEERHAMQADDQRVARLEERVAFLERTAVLQPTEEYNPQLLNAMEPYEMPNKAPRWEEMRDAWVIRVWLANTPNQIRNATCPTDAMNRQPHNAMQANDRVTACATRIQTLERRIGLHELRLGDIKAEVFGTNVTKEAAND